MAPLRKNPSTFLQKPFLIGVCGGSGSGKTTFAQEIATRLAPKGILHLKHDSYYRDQTHLPMAERVQTNYDHPDSLQTDLLVEHLHALVSGKPVDLPVYDFSEHTRMKRTDRALPQPVILLEGILIFTDPQLRDLLDLKIFIDTQPDIRLARRLARDVAERGRTFEFGLEQYLTFTKPMHEQFVEPSKRFADVIIPEGGQNPQALQLVQRLLESV